MRSVRIATFAALLITTLRGIGASVAACAMEPMAPPRLPRRERVRRATAPTYRDLLSPHGGPKMPQRPPRVPCRRGPWKEHR